jgi:hypothetical protein
MSLFTGGRDLPGPVSVQQAAKARAAGLQVQPESGVHHLRYWVDERHGKIFSLIDARTRSPRTPCTASRTA